MQRGQVVLSGELRRFGTHRSPSTCQAQVQLPNTTTLISHVSIPSVQNRLAYTLNIRWCGPHITTCDPVKRSFLFLSDTFCCQGLACPGAAVKQDEKALAFASNNVRSCFKLGPMSTDGSLDQFLGLGRRHKLLKCILVPCDIGKLVNANKT